MTETEKAAIIGHWRNGALTEQISVVMGIAFWKVERVIDDYKRQLLENNSSILKSI